MLWMRRGRKHGNVHGDRLNWSACLLALTPSGFDLAGLDLTHTITYPKNIVYFSVITSINLSASLSQ